MRGGARTIPEDSSDVDVLALRSGDDDAIVCRRTTSSGERRVVRAEQASPAVAQVARVGHLAGVPDPLRPVSLQHDVSTGYCSGSSTCNTGSGRRSDATSADHGDSDMAVPEGQWNINVNGFKGTLNITSQSGVLSGSSDIDNGFTDVLQGVWNDPAREIVFNRVMSRNGQKFIQTYTGYLYTTKEQIFQGQGPPEPNPTFRLLTGHFEAIGTGSSPSGARGGWVARQRI
jgi:hypothetical protein